jgi:hypothetical protein
MRRREQDSGSMSAAGGTSCRHPSARTQPLDAVWSKQQHKHIPSPTRGQASATQKHNGPRGSKNVLRRAGLSTVATKQPTQRLEMGVALRKRRPLPVLNSGHLRKRHGHPEARRVQDDWQQSTRQENANAIQPSRQGYLFLPTGPAAGRRRCNHHTPNPQGIAAAQMIQTKLTNRNHQQKS